MSTDILLLSDADLYDDVSHLFRTGYDLRQVNKRKSPLMRFIAERILGGGNIVDSQAFMERFTTTIWMPWRGPVAFVSWDPDSPSPASGYTYARRIETLTHETQHVVQMHREGRKRFSVGYVADHRFRASMEIEAYQLSCCLAAHIVIDGPRTYFRLPFDVEGGSGDHYTSPAAMASMQRRAYNEAQGALRSLTYYSLSTRELDRAAEELFDFVTDPTQVWQMDAAKALSDLFRSLWEYEHKTPLGVDLRRLSESTP